MADVLEGIKTLEARGFSFEAAEASVAMMMKRQDPTYLPPFQLVDFFVNVEHREEPRPPRRGDGEGPRRWRGPVHSRRGPARSPRSTAHCASAAAALPAHQRAAARRLQVRILDGKNGTAATTRVLVDVQHGKRRWSTVGASPNIIEASWRALVDALEYGLTVAADAEGVGVRAKFVVLPGDGIGPEVTAEALRVLEAVAKKGGHAFEAIGAPHGRVLDRPARRRSRPRCSRMPGVERGAPRRGRRAEVGRSAGEGPAGARGCSRCARGSASSRTCGRCACTRRSLASPLKADRLAGVDLLVIRELTGGLYFGQPKGRDEKDGHVRAVDTLEYHDYEIRRVVELAFKLARGRRRKVLRRQGERARVLAAVASGHHRDRRREPRRRARPHARRHRRDAARRRPATLDVVVTENMFGDILTDEASCSPARWACSPSASIGRAAQAAADPRVRARHRRAGSRTRSARSCRPR